MSKEKQIDFGKVQRWGMVTKTWYEDTYEVIDECSYGNFIRYEDYKRLLDTKSPQRSASFDDFKTIVNKKIKGYEARCDEIFEQRDKTNYGFAVNQRELANILSRALYLLESEMKHE